MPSIVSSLLNILQPCQHFMICSHVFAKYGIACSIRNSMLDVYSSILFQLIVFSWLCTLTVIISKHSHRKPVIDGHTCVYVFSSCFVVYWYWLYSRPLYCCRIWEIGLSAPKLESNCHGFEASHWYTVDPKYDMSFWYFIVIHHNCLFS